ncbi:MAG: PHP domain-containing protein [Candidatus Limnocylindrales bacterium]
MAPSATPPVPAYAELHCHSHFSFLDGASGPDDLVARAVELGLTGLARTDHQGLYGAVRFSTAAEAAGLHPVVGIEIELLDAAVADPGGIVVPARRAWRPGRRPPVREDAPRVVEGRPTRPRPERARLPGHRAIVKEDHRGIGEGQRGPHLVLLARDAIGWRSLCRLVSHANLAGTKAVPAFTHALLEEHHEGLVALSGCREGELARRLRAGDREGARALGERYATLFGVGESAGSSGFVLELGHHLLPDDDWLASETARLADELGLPVVVTNDVHYALPEGRELQDVLTAIRHGRSLGELADLRRPDGESYLKGSTELLAMPPGEPSTAAHDPALARRWREGIAASVEIAAACRVELAFERYRFPGYPVPKGQTPFSHLSELCWEGARRRYHPLTPAVVAQLAHELEVISKTGLAEFFLICWDLMRFAKGRGIPAQGRGSAADSIVAYVLGITRVDPIRHELLFERFINEGRTSYPDVDIDFSSKRREEVIQYVYERYGAEHTGMVCNLVTYRARSAVREVGYALGFPRPLVDRVAKALETYDSVMVRRDLEAEGGFARFFARPEEGVEGPGGDAVRGSRRLVAEMAVAGTAALAGDRGLTDSMGQLNHARGGRFGADAAPSSAAAPSAHPALPRRGTRGVGPDPAPLRSRSVVSADSGGPDFANARTTPSERTAGGPGGEEDAGKGGAADAATTGERDVPGGERWLGGDVSDAWLRHQVGALGPGEDEGGPGDSPVSVRWLRDGPPSRVLPPSRELERHNDERHNDERHAPPTIDGRRLDPDTGILLPEERRWDPRTGPNLPIGGVSALDRPIDRLVDGEDDKGGPGDETAAARRWAREDAERRARARDAVAATKNRSSSVARLAPVEELRPPAERPPGGSVAGLSDWERWLELCARIDGFPRHLSIHTGGMLVTAAPLIDIAPLERATMPNRVVVQYDKRDVETMKLIKLDLLGLGMLAAIDECIQLVEHDCAVCLDLDHIPEEIPEVFAMLQAADTVGVFQVESRAQMQTLPKSRPETLDDLVVEVAIIRPGPIQGNAVHPYLRRKQGIEPVQYLHPSLEPILHDTLGVILYQEQVMKVAIHVAGFTPAGSDGFRRAMGTWRSSREMEKLHIEFVEGCIRVQGVPRDDAEELFRQCAAFASFGFAKSHAAAFARTAYESSFLKLFYPAQFVVGLVNAQPMGFYPVEVLVNDAKRHGVAILPVDVNQSSYRTTTEWVGRPGWALAGALGDDGSHDADPGEPLPEGVGIDAYPRPVRSSACVIPGTASRDRWAAESMTGWGVRLGLHLVKGIGEEQAARLDAELARGPYADLGDVVERTGLSEEVVERLIRSGALDSLGRPRRELLWQLREVAGATKGRMDGRTVRGAGRQKAAGRPMGLRLPATEAPALPALTEPERLGDAYAVVGLDARRQAVSLFREALARLGAVPNAALADRKPGPVRIGGLVVTRQHPMTARGTVFLALEDETGMVNVTLWPDTWQRLRSTVRRHALLLVEGDLQREGNVVNVVARSVTPLVEAANDVGGPGSPAGVRQIGQAGMRRLG